MEPNLFKYIWRHSRREQVAILLLVVLSLPFYYFSLNLPKQIVNQGIQGKGFEGPGATQTFGEIVLPFSDLLFGRALVLFDGLALDQRGLLLALSFTFLGLVFINGGFKFQINTAKGRLGERMLRRLRYELADRLLRFRLPQMRKMKGPEVATMIKDEVEPLGGFIGDAFITPAFLGSQAITAMVFIMIQSFWLGLIAGAIVLAQALVIPRLRVPILRLGKERQLTARQLAGRVGEVMDGAVEVHANDASNWERAELTGRLARIFDIRYEIYRRKFFVKFLNNFLSQLTPFIFYAGGGLLALSGHLDIGALVAVIAAYKDLPGPIRELINWEQQRNDVQIKYDQVIEQFQPSDILDPAAQDPEAPATPLTGNLVANAVGLFDENGSRPLEGVSFTLPVHGHAAVVGDGVSGKEYLASLLAGLVPPTMGRLEIGGRDVTSLPEAVTGRRMAFVDHDTYFFPHSLRDNLYYGLRHRPIAPAVYDEDARAAAERQREEAARAGNAVFDPNADWIDYAAAGVAGGEELARRTLDLMALVGLADDIYRFGLNGTLDADANAGTAEELLQARHALTQRLEAQGHSELVVRFDAEHYNRNASLAENLLFGTPKDPSFATEALADNRLVRAVIKETGIAELLLEKGLTVARTMVEIFADLPPGHPFFEQFSFIGADDLPEFRQIVARAEQRGLAQLPADDRRRLLGLPFRYIEARHRLGLIDEGFEARVLEARRAIATRVEREAPGAVEFYRLDTYNTASSIMDNILFGRIAHGQAGAEETVATTVGEVLRELGLYGTVCAVGLDFNVGNGGKRLSATQRQKLALARALLKQPDLMIVNQATAAMDGTTRNAVVQATLKAREGRGVLWILERAALARHFDKILVMRAGRIVEQGTFPELDREGTAFHQLLSAD